MELRYLLKALLLPPVFQILLLLLAWSLRRHTPKLARAGFLLAVLSLWAFASPVTAIWLARSLERDPPILPDQLAKVQADAIVILSAGQNDTTPEFGQSISRPDQLARVRYGAFLHHRTGLPILLSGGSVFGTDQRSLAETMAFDLADGFGGKARWLETESRTTAENGKFSYTILAAEGRTRIVLVTSALHMMRAKWSFEHAGFSVQPAPCGLTDPDPLAFRSFIPNPYSLKLSSQSMHEWLGYLAYRALDGG